MWWTGKNYSHVARSIEIRDWGQRYYQASEGKVNYEYEDYFMAKHHIVKKYELSISEDLDRDIKKACYKEAGNKYATMQNLGIVLVDIAAFFGLKIKNPWKKGRNCSELIYTQVLKKMYPELAYNPDTIKPHQIDEILMEKGFKPSEGDLNE